MNIYSLNQTRQLYVASAYDTVTSDSATGTIKAVTIGKGFDKEVYLAYKGVSRLTKSDRIQVRNIESVKATDAADLVYVLKSKFVYLDPEVNNGDPVSGQDYLLRIVLRQFYGMSDEDLYFKEGVVHATANMTADKFYEAMVKSLNSAFSREVDASNDSNPYLKFEVATETVDGNSVKGVKVTEKPQPWTLGLEQQVPVLFELTPTTIYLDGSDYFWGKTADVTPEKSAATVGTDAIGDGHNIADLEYFCMGERGDQYRMRGFPNYIPTKYLVDPDKQYHVLDIHYAFTDSGINSYKSEKDITVVSTDKSVINSIITELNAATGETFDTLSV